MEFYIQLRQQMIDVLQISLKQVRQVLGLGVQEFGDVVGLTRQSINNLESGKIKMSTVQFVAVCAVIDHFTETHPELLPIIKSILISNDTLHDSSIYENIEGGSFLKKWFLCFPDDSKLVMPRLSLIDDIASNYRIFVDDSFLCGVNIKNQFEDLLDAMKAAGKQVIIPLKVIESIQNNMLANDEEVSNKAHKAMQLLAKLQSQNFVEIRGEKGDVNILTTLVSVFVKYKVTYRLALITNNAKLAKSILSLNSDDIGGFKILVLRCNCDGMLEEWQLNDYFEKADEDEYDSEDEQIRNFSEEEIQSDNEYKQDSVVSDTVEDLNTQIPIGWDTI